MSSIIKHDYHDYMSRAHCHIKGIVCSVMYFLSGKADGIIHMDEYGLSLANGPKSDIPDFSICKLVCAWRSALLPYHKV